MKLQNIYYLRIKYHIELVCVNLFLILEKKVPRSDGSGEKEKEKREESLFYGILLRMLDLLEGDHILD